jgi:hypothetical protein
VLRSEHPFSGGQGLLVQPDGLGVPASLAVDGGKVVSRHQSVGIVGTEDPLEGGEGLLQQRDRVGGPARLLLGVGEVAPRRLNIRMVRAERLLQILG